MTIVLLQQLAILLDSWLCYTTNIFEELFNISSSRIRLRKWRLRMIVRVCVARRTLRGMTPFWSKYPLNVIKKRLYTGLSPFSCFFKSVPLTRCCCTN